MSTITIKKCDRCGVKRDVANIRWADDKFYVLQLKDNSILQPLIASTEVCHACKEFIRAALEPIPQAVKG